MANLKPLDKDLQAARAEYKSTTIGTRGNELKDADTSQLEEIPFKKIHEADVQPCLLAKARELKEA